MRLPTIFRVGIAVLALAPTLYAPPVARPMPRAVPHSVPHSVPHEAPRSVPHEAPRSGESPHTESANSSHTSAAEAHRSTQNFEFRAPQGETALPKDYETAQPYVFSALPTGDAYEHTFGDHYTAAKEAEMRNNEQTARSIPGVESRISNTFHRDDLLTAIASHKGKRPFILICHSEGPNENRVIPLGGNREEKIKEDELRRVCSEHDTELFLVSCHSKDLNIAEEISYGEAFRMVKLAMEQRTASSGMTVGQLKAALVATAEKELKPGVELRISYGSDVKKVVIVSAAGGGGGDSDGFPWFKTLIGIVIGIVLIRWIYRKATNA